MRGGVVGEELDKEILGGERWRRRDDGDNWGGGVGERKGAGRFNDARGVFELLMWV